MSSLFNSPTLRIHPLSRFSEFSSNLTERHFFGMLGMAVLLHIAWFIGYQLMPREQVLQIPVKALNIKLGGADAADLDTIPDVKPSDAPAALAALDAAVNAPLTNAEPDSVKSEQPVKTRKVSRRAAASANAMPSEYVRQGEARAQGKGNPLGNSAEGEEVMRRYEQVLSLWIERHKVYPSAAREQEMEGDAIVRLRINREGKIVQYRLEKATRFEVLNDAIEDMVRSANPVPAVPSNYPEGSQFEFLIPVTFRLQ